MQFRLLSCWLQNMVYRKLIIIIFVCTFLSSCFLPDGWSGWRSRPYWGIKNLPPADTDYGRGFEHGCRHGLFVTAKGFLADDLSDSGLNVDELVNNEQFSLGYYDGFEQCTYIQDWDVI